MVMKVPVLPKATTPRPSRSTSALWQSGKRPPAYYTYVLGAAQFGLEQYEQAAKSLETVTKRTPDLAPAHYLLISAHGHLGYKSEAEAAITRLNAVRKGFDMREVSVTYAETDIRYQHDADMNRYLEGIHKAGVPEDPVK